VLGAYLEGPYFAEKERGAQPLGLIGPPDPADYRPTLEEFGGFVKVWALAPELPGAMELIRALQDSGAIAALGHSACIATNEAEGVTHPGQIAKALAELKSVAKRAGRSTCVRDRRGKYLETSSDRERNPAAERRTLTHDARDAAADEGDATAQRGGPDSHATADSHGR
jgi:hypothetical protein